MKPIPDALRKLTILVGDSFFTMLLAVALLPIDALPWFGTSPDLLTSWQRFRSGVDWIFANKANNAWMGAGYVAAELSTYLSCAYLNEYSPTLSSFVVQLAGPITALLVIAFPTLQPSSGSASEDRSAAAVSEQLGGVVLVGVSCWLYYRWEVETAGEHKSVTRRPVSDQQKLSDGDEATAGEDCYLQI
jgi:hypothetical protein